MQKTQKTSEKLGSVKGHVGSNQHRVFTRDLLIHDALFLDASPFPS